MKDVMCQRAALTVWVVTAALVLAMPIFAHPGHEYRSKG